MYMKAKLHSVSITAVSCLLLVTVLVFSIFLATSKKASALVGSEFIASRITDDSIFFNGYALDTTTIQNFLNSKVPACDTNGTQAYGGTTRAAYASRIIGKMFPRVQQKQIYVTALVLVINQLHKLFSKSAEAVMSVKRRL